jgi:hypothetical protein
MVQNISIERVDEQGKTLAQSGVNFATIINRFETITDWKIKYPLLSKIDPYGDTYLNILQRPDFVLELLRFSKEQQFEISKELTSFISDTGVHQYIKFIGD